jgi:hypothetical protein
MGAVMLRDTAVRILSARLPAGLTSLELETLIWDVTLLASFTVLELARLTA